MSCPASFTMQNHNAAIDSSLYGYASPGAFSLILFSGSEIPGEKKYVYLGYETVDEIYDGKLPSMITQQTVALDCDTPGCSATLHLSSNDNTGAGIRFSLDDCLYDRYITFSYKDSVIFTIDQDCTYIEPGDRVYSTRIYVYKVNSYNSYIALYTGNIQVPQYSDSGSLGMAEKFDVSNSTLICFNETTNNYYENRTIRELLQNRLIERVDGHDELFNTTGGKYYNLTIHTIRYVNEFINNGDSFRKIESKKDMHLCVYYRSGNTMVNPGEYFSFGDLDNTNHLGVYDIYRPK